MLTALAMAALQDEKAALAAQLAGQTGGITAKLRRLEARLEKEKEEGRLVKAAHAELAKEAERVTRRLERYEPEAGAQGGMSALRRTKTVLRGMQNHLMQTNDAASGRRAAILADPARLHSAGALIGTLSQSDRWRLLRVGWESFGLPTAAIDCAQSQVRLQSISQLGQAVG